MEGEGNEGRSTCTWILPVPSLAALFTIKGTLQLGCGPAAASSVDASEHPRKLYGMTSLWRKFHALLGTAFPVPPMPHWALLQHRVRGPPHPARANLPRSAPLHCDPSFLAPSDTAHPHNAWPTSILRRRLPAPQLAALPEDEGWPGQLSVVHARRICMPDLSTSLTNVQAHQGMGGIWRCSEHRKIRATTRRRKTTQRPEP